MLLSANVSQKEILINTSGTCGYRSDSEDVGYLLFLD